MEDDGKSACACSFLDISTIKNKNPIQKTSDINKTEFIPQEKIAFCLFEVDTWNIPEEDLISKP
jgi:hypothetical protein